MEWVLINIFARTHTTHKITTHKKHANTNDHGRRRPVPDTSYDHLHMELRPPYYTYKEGITRASQQYHCHIFSTAGSPTAAHLRYCTGTNDISPTMAATDAPHDNLPMDLRPQYCTDRAPITSTLHDNHQIIFPAAGSLSVDRLRVELYLHEIPTTMAATDTPYDHHPMELQPWYCTRRAPITST
jgi:hypothetical protein